VVQCRYPAWHCSPEVPEPISGGEWSCASLLMAFKAPALRPSALTSSQFSPFSLCVCLLLIMRNCFLAVDSIKLFLWQFLTGDDHSAAMILGCGVHSCEACVLLGVGCNACAVRTTNCDQLCLLLLQPVKNHCIAVVLLCLPSHLCVCCHLPFVVFAFTRA